MKVLMVEKNGIINEVEYVESVDRISKDRVREILIDALNTYNTKVKVENINEGERDIYIVKYLNDTEREDMFICIREMTPGGRRHLKDEQRIQPQSQQINFIFNINKSGGRGVLLGAYERDGEIVLAAWKANYSNAASPTTGISKQIKVDTIAKAMKLGFVQQSKGKGEFACVFRKEFIHFYIQNSTWIHSETIEELIEHTNQTCHEEIVEFTLSDTVKDKYNRILFGAPGTGKSHKLNKDIEENQDKLVDKYTRVTFHPNYTYAQFVGSYKPVSEMEEKVLDNGTIIKQKTISYKFVPGPFLKVLIKALKDETIPQLLVIEEINRANPAAVFGDVFQLLDRDSNGKSCYTISMSEEMHAYVEEELGSQIDELYIPSNMYIWATMNSADQGVYPMDSAFKRRWYFEYIGIDKNEDELIGKDYEYIYLKNSKDTYGRYKWNTVRKTINKELRSGRKINEDKLLGPFFLSETELSKSNLKNNEEFDNIFKSKVLMYLYEDIVKHKNINIFTENILSEIMNAYDQGKVFTFEIECEPEKETMENESPQVVSEDRNKLYSSHSAAEEEVQYNIEG